MPNTPIPDLGFTRRPRLVTSASRLCGAALRSLDRCYDRHLQRADLAELTDDQLRDIGLTRREVAGECAPFWKR